jgi:Complex I intermediate-associated protein 30 (CIA30)
MIARATTPLRHFAALALTGLAITINTHAAPERILFDFQAPNNSPAWRSVNDDVMGGVSTSSFQILTNGGAVFSGVVSLENNGGFASVRSSPARHDLTGSRSFVIRLRGDHRRQRHKAEDRDDDMKRNRRLKLPSAPLPREAVGVSTTVNAG